MGEYLPKLKEVVDIILVSQIQDFCRRRTVSLICNTQIYSSIYLAIIIKIIKNYQPCLSNHIFFLCSRIIYLNAGNDYTYVTTLKSNIIIFTYKIGAMGNQCCQEPKLSPKDAELDLNFSEKKPLSTPKNSSIPHPQIKIVQSTESQRKDLQNLADSKDIPKRLIEEFHFPIELQKCIGVIKQPKKFNRQTRVLGNGIMIGSGLVLTTMTNILDEENEPHSQMYFFSQWNQQPYHISQVYIRGQSIPTVNKSKHLNYCILTLSKKIAQWVGCPLELEVPPDLDCVFTSKIKGINKNEATTETEQVQTFSLYKKDSLIYFPEYEGQCGSPIAMIRQNRWSLIGMICEINEKEHSSLGLLITQELIERQINSIPLGDLEQINVRQYSKMRQLSLEQYHQQYLENRRSKSSKSPPTQLTKQEMQRNFAQRMSCEIGIKIIGRYFEHIHVNQVRLYFELYQSKKVYTINDLCQQYHRTIKKTLKLPKGDSTLRLEMPLTLIMREQQEIKQFQKLLNSFNSNSKTSLVSERYLQRLRKAIRRFEPRLKNKGKEVLIKIKREDEIIDEIYHKIGKNTTIHQILDHLTQRYNYNFKKIKVYTNDDKIQLKDYEYRLKELQNHEISIIFKDLERYFSSNSLVKKQTNEDAGIKECLNTFHLTKFLSFDEVEKKLSYQSRNRVYQFKNVQNFLRITYLLGGKQYKLDCTEDSLIMIHNYQWIVAKHIKVGLILLGVDENERDKLIEGQVISIEDRRNDSREIFYNFQIKNTHNFVANNIIVHNENPIKLRVKKYEKRESSQFDIEVYLNEQIGLYFENYRVFLGQYELKKTLTFGDYHIYNSNYLQIVQLGIQKERQLQSFEDLEITQWRVGTKKLKKYCQQELIKIRKNFYAFYQGTIHMINDNFFRTIARKGHTNIIIQEKALLAHLSFEVKRDKSCKYGEQLLSGKDYFGLHPGDTKESFKRIGITYYQQQMMRLYYGKGYQSINQFLLNTDIDAVPDDHPQIVKASVLSKALDKMLPLKKPTVVFRGLKKRQYEQQIAFERVTEKILLFRNFTSTSICPSVARNFTNQGGAFLQIKTSSGKYLYGITGGQQEVLIQPFSYFYIQKQYIDEYKRNVMQLHEMTLPKKKDTSNIVYWLDRHYPNSLTFFEDFNPQVDNITITMPAINMRSIIQHFLWTQTLLNKNIIFVANIEKIYDRDTSALSYFYPVIDFCQLIISQLGLSRTLIIAPLTKYRQLNSIDIRLKHIEIERRNLRLVTNKEEIVAALNHESKVAF